uniref:Lysosome-associated membrane glycoprotein 1 n=1 Tax=Mola mola TaxID=94237 RepID=A0A3Q3WYD7_MOLML
MLTVFSFIGCIQAVTLELNEGNSTCIKAELSASFSITYNATNSMVRTVTTFSLPDTARVDTGSSSCGTNGSSARLVAVFGPGHALGLSFSTNGSLYSVANLTVQYNLSDTSVFPEANSSDVVTVVSSSVGIWATMNTTYRCISPASFDIGGANVTFSNVRMEAYMRGNDLSPRESVCVADQASTTVPPTTASTTTITTNSSGTVCLLAKVGLQLNVSYFSQSQGKIIQALVNLSPKMNSSGSCEASRATLTLTQEQTTTLSFTFTLNSTKYHLSEISLVANWSDMAEPLSASNSSLNYLQSSLSHSYMCNAEQVLTVVPAFSLNTFKLQVQPFSVTNNQFSTAEECQVDQDQMLIPIIVGASLAGLVLIVLIAYLIGRKRSHAGYQTI